MKNDTSEYYFSLADTVSYSLGTRHYHHTLELYYMEEGFCSYFIDNRSYEVSKGDLVIIPEGIIHKTIYKSGTTHTRWLINCSEKYIPKSVLPELRGLGYIYRNPSVAKKLVPIFKRIAEEYKRSDRFRDEALACLTGELLFLLVRNTSDTTSVTLGNIFVEQTVRYIQENYMNEITLPEMAKMRSVSPEHLSRMFKKETGLCFSEYLTLVRLRAAEYMLKNEPGRSVAEIAYSCGFNDSNYFSTKFKNMFGVSPRQLRD